MKLRNRIMSAVMAIVASMTFIGATAFAADGAVVLNASATKVKAGDTITVEVNVTENPGLYALGYQITGTDGIFTLTNVVDSKNYAGGVLSKDYTKATYGLFWTMDDTASENDTTTGLAATMTYSIAADATPGDYEIKIVNKGSDNIDFEEPDMGSYTLKITVEGETNIVRAEYAVEEKDNKADKAEGEAYTQGFKVEVIGNDETVTAVPFTLKAEGKEKAYAGFTGLNITGATPVYFGLNVKEVPADKTVAAEFSLTVAE